MSRRAWVFIPLFFCSGATALIYEVVWAKYLAQMFGSTIHAQTVVLAVFMGGLALGNSLFGRKADQLKRPVYCYGVLEIAIGVYAFGFAPLYALADKLFVQVGSPLLAHSGLLLALKALLSVALLLGPTVLMGGTLPLLASWLNSNLPDAGRCCALFYAVNSLGAVLGAGLAGFYLVSGLGLLATLQATALLNVVIGGIAITLGRPANSEPTPRSNAGGAAETTVSATPLPRAAYLVAITGAISMGLEVLASRSLAMIFGSSLQAFSVVLIAFILGIGLGSVWICQRRLRWSPDSLAIALLLLAAMWVGLLVWNIENWVAFYRWAVTGVARTPVGYKFHHVLTAGMSIGVLGVPAALLGCVLPLQIRSHSNGAAALGKQTGQLLTWNTLGAVVGVLATGFILMPTIGLRSSFLVLALLLCAAAALGALKIQLKNHVICSSGVAAALALILLFAGQSWRSVMSSGVFRAREKTVDLRVMELRKKHVKILFYKDAADATVAVEEGDGIGVPKSRSLSLNGKADASTRGDVSTQLLVGHLPLLSKPDSKDVFILGLGSGISAGAVAAHPIETLTIAENCGPVIRAARFFDPWNRGVLTNQLTRVLQEDARTILKLSPKRYDVIITQPSNPWTAGNGSVFSREFYELVKSRLQTGGLVAQWFQVYDMHDGIVSLILRTFTRSFPFVELWDTGSGDIVLLGALQPWSSGADTYESGFAREWVQKDLERIGIQSPAALLVRQLASQRTAFAIAGDGALQTDNFPILEYEAPRAFFLGETSRMLSKYDERTVQAASTPPAKRQALLGADAASLRRVFAEFGTINPEFKATGYSLSRDPKPAAPPIPPNVSPEIRELLSACGQLDSHEFSDGADRIARLIHTRTPASSDWSAAHYATLAAKACLASGDTTRAWRLVRLGLKVDANAELLYLDRVLEREQAPGHRQLSAVK
jgi:spermidine synthase